MVTALQVKTSYSILGSLNDIPKLVDLAVNYGYTSLAITDEGNMFGVMEFYNECKKRKIKPIIGLELTLLDTKILLYAKDINGYKNLIKLSTIVSDTDLTIDDLKKYADNLILVMPFMFYNEEVFNIYQDKFVGYDLNTDLNDISRPAVFINNVRYLNEHDYRYLDYAHMIRDGKIIGEYELNKDSGSYLLKQDELDKYIRDDVKNNMKYIEDNCNLTIEYTKGLLPVYDSNIDSKSFLRNLAVKGLNKRLDNKVTNEYKERLDYELSVIDKMGFNDYFLIVYDYVLYAKKHDILVGPGRGSAAGSLVSYTLGITDIDPIKYNLLFERFLNPERVTMPDIDIDFDALKRQEVIDYVISKYGEKNVSGIISFNTLGAKQVIRDLGRVLNLSPKLIDMVAKLCTKGLQTTYMENNNFKKLISNNDDLKKLYDIAIHLEGLPRHVSVHAAGVVMSKYDLVETIPLYKNQLGMYVSAYDKDYLEPLGLIKMDLLGISNLTLIDNVIKNIQNDMHLNITFNNIPMDDKKTFKLFAEGDTEGIFQFEAPGMIRFLKELKVNNFNDIVAATSLYRPGPMDSIPSYLKRRSGKEEVDYFHPDLEDILKETYGIIIYQEQVMQIAQVLAGYTLGEADILRRAISKKKEEILQEEGHKFINGSVKRGYSKDLAERVYDLILKFADYGFNKSHAVAYAMIAYKMSFLKTHFYSYFMVSLLTNSISNEEKTSNYISKLRQHNVMVLLPDINVSTGEYIVNDKKIICPLSIIRNVASNVTNIIIRERENGLYKDFIDFVRRTYNKGINKRILESLILAGTFDNLGYNRHTLIINLENIINYAELVSDNSLILVEEPIIDEVMEYSKDELIKGEYDIFGFYISNHPVTKYKNKDDFNTLMIPGNVNKRITIILEVVNKKEITTKKNDVMAFVRAGDEYRVVDLTLFPDVYKESNDIEKRDIIKVTGVVEKRLSNYQIVVSKISNLSKE